MTHAPRHTTFQVGDTLEFWGLTGEDPRNKPIPLVVQRIFITGDLQLRRMDYADMTFKDGIIPDPILRLSITNARVMVDEGILTMKEPT